MKVSDSFGAGSIPENSLIGWIISTIPTLTCMMLFLSPIPTFKQVLKDKGTRNLPALPYVSMTLQCLFWATYGLLISSFTVTIPNVFGGFLGLSYTVIFHRYANDFTSLYQLYFVGFLSLCLYFFLFFFSEDRNNAIGSLAATSTALFIFSPLIMILHVCQEKSVASLPFHMSFLTFANASAWIIFAWFVRNDAAILFPNILGFISGTLQLCCHAMFGNISQNLRNMSTSFKLASKRKVIDQFDPFEDLDLDSEGESIVLT